jgi:Mn-dependent DtxR family transcriptional regulator
MQFMPSHSEAERIEHYMEGSTEDALQDALRRMVPGWFPDRMGPGLQSTEGLKREIELYWTRERSSAAAQKP